MIKEILPALVAFTGVILSIIVSYFISRRNAKVEILKIRSMESQLYSGKLYEHRLEAYWEIYICISEFAKLLKHETVDKKIFNKFFVDMKEFDSKYSFYFGATTTFLSGRFISYLKKIDDKEEDAFLSHLNAKEHIEELGIEMGQYELALKNECGIFKFDTLLKMREEAEFWSYKELDEEVSKAYLEARARILPYNEYKKNYPKK
jgi:hypothetical protein